MMKLLFWYNILFFIISSLIVINPASAEGLGRLFTTPVERRKLDKIRIAKPKPKKVEVVVEEIIEPVVAEEKEVIIRDAITLHGVVHRSDGKNTAWVNDSNTFEGDLESQYIEIPNETIMSDNVTVVMPDNSTNVKIKVGDSYLPENSE